MLPGALCAITDRARARDPLPQVVRELVQGGVRWVRVREPDLDLHAYVTLMHTLLDAAGDARVTWSVRPSAYVLLRSLYPELRLGVHLAGRDAPWQAPDDDVLLGRSVHVNAPWPEAASEPDADADARAAANADGSADADANADTEAMRAPDYLLLAPVFATASKPGVTPTGTAAIAALVRAQSVPVVALGGVQVGNVGACRDAGAAAVAVCGALFSSAEPADIVRQLLAAWGDSVHGP